MEDELERIKHVLEIYQTNEAKIDFLLRQVEWLVKVNDSYKTQITKMKNQHNVEMTEK